MKDFKNADLEKLIKSGELTLIDETFQKVFRLQDRNGKVYYFKKSVREKTSWLKELLGRKAAEFFGKTSINYERVMFAEASEVKEELKRFNLSDSDISSIFEKRKFCECGVISEDFTKQDCSYIDGNELISDYINFLSDEKLLEYYSRRIRKYLIPYINDLETIWNALEYRYRDRENKNEIVKGLMSEFTDLYEFAVIISDYDRVKINYMIEESKAGGEVSMTPYFDYEMIFFDDNEIALSVEHEDTSAKFETSLSKYLKYVTKEQRERFIAKFESLTVDVISGFLDDIILEYSLNEEERTELLAEKSKIIERYKAHRNRLQTVISDYSTGKSM